MNKDSFIKSDNSTFRISLISRKTMMRKVISFLLYNLVARNKLMKHILTKLLPFRVQWVMHLKTLMIHSV